MFDLVQHRKPVKFEAFIMIIIVFFMLGYPMIGIPNMVPHIPVLITIIFLLLYGTVNKVKFSLLQESIIIKLILTCKPISFWIFIMRTNLETAYTTFKTFEQSRMRSEALPVKYVPMIS